MNISITGIAGFLGSHLARAMIARGHNVSGIDNMIGGSKSNVPDQADFVVADCTDFDAMRRFFERTKPEVLYHCAATAHEGLSVFSPSYITKNIYEASVTTFSAAIASGVKRIVFCSSMARYGKQIPPFDEGQSPIPQDPYGIAKLAAEQTLEVLAKVHGIEYVIAVPHNIIGAGQCCDDPYRNVASIMINRMRQELQPVIYGDGEQKRCFSYIDDVLTVLTLLATADNVNGQVFNVGPDENPVTINELANTIGDVLGIPVAPIYMPGRPQEVEIAICSSQKIRHVFGYKTQTDLKTAIKIMADHIAPTPFNYDRYPIEIINKRTPLTWTNRII